MTWPRLAGVSVALCGLCLYVGGGCRRREPAGVALPRGGQAMSRLWWVSWLEFVLLPSAKPFGGAVAVFSVCYPWLLLGRKRWEHLHPRAQAGGCSACSRPCRGDPGVARSCGPSVRLPGVVGGSVGTEPSESISGCVVPAHAPSASGSAALLFSHLPSSPPPVRSRGLSLPPQTSQLCWGAPRGRLRRARSPGPPSPRRRGDRAIMKTSVGAEAGERGAALQLRSWGSRGGSFMYDHVYVSDRL